mmetsp:Transcript_123953/g.246788  ORF Transcript_123953/g.246788 Transcript_123953/m.246788 type:complete len:395 (+) Transcript_123953:48-1232(+)
MSVIDLSVRVVGGEVTHVNIAENETVESLAVVVYSLLPELGEELRIVHKGRVLKPEQVLSEIGIKNGDSIAACRQPATAQPATLPAESTPVPAAPEVPSDMGIKRDDAITVAEQPASTQPVDPPVCAGSQEEPQQDVAAAVESVQSPDTTTEAETVKEESKPSTDSGGIKREAEVSAEVLRGEADEGAQDQVAESAEPAPEPETVLDLTSTAGLMEYAELLERGGKVPEPWKQAQAVRDCATRMNRLEETVAHLGRGLQLVHAVSGGALGAAPGGPEMPSADSHPAYRDDTTKSFLIKKGDAEVQELHRLANQPELKRQISGSSPSSTGGGGALSSESKSKEEMARAREARLAALEAKQAEKQKEREDAEEKSKARDAMFKSSFVGPAKPIGKH